jgi:preprotein translocase subunit SecB
LELSAKRADEEASQDLLFKEEPYEIEPEFNLQFGRDDDAGRFRVRLKTLIESDPGKILVDAAAEYTVEGVDVATIPEDLMLEFANQVAVFAIIPYLRQAVADMTQRVFGVPLTMPMYRRGELVFTAKPSSAE